MRRIDDSEVIELLRNLVRIPSVSLHEKEIGEFIVSKLQEWGFQPERQSVEKDRFNVICRLKGEGEGPSILFNGHIDTQKTEGMTIDPFSAELKDGRVYGRGSADMKAGLAAIMSAFKAVRKSGVKLKGEAIIAFTVGEELDSKGIKALAESNIKADMGVCAEISNLRLAIGHKGGYSGKITTKGVATHSSIPEKGVNAIYKMMKVIEGLRNMPFLKDEDPLFGRSTVSIGTIQGGRWYTWVPDYCTIEYNFRLTPKYTPEYVKNQIEKLLGRLKDEDPQFEAEFTGFGDSAVLISKDEPIVGIARRALEYVLKKPIEVWGAPYWTDAATLITKCGIPTVVLGPGGIEQAHSANEWVNIDETVKAAKVYALMILYALT